MRIQVVCAAVALLLAALLATTTAQAAQCVALTFDDGPDPVLTPRLLKILAELDVKVTFFVKGLNAAAYPGIVRAAFNAGHEIGNHSWDHPQFSKISLEEAASQITRTDAAIIAATGTKPLVIRPPYGDAPNAVRTVAGGRRVVLWDTDTLDWKYPDPDRITRVAVAHAEGGIILMHDTHPSTIAAVPGIIAGLKLQGVQFVTVSQMLASGCNHSSG